MTATVSAMDSASSWSWVTSSDVAPEARSTPATSERISVAEGGVEAAEGLVEQDDAGVGRQRPGQGHPLLLAARELVRHAAAQPRASPASSSMASTALSRSAPRRTP